MSHERFEILLVKATDGKLSADERRELDAHLAACARCRDELRDFRLIKEATDAMTSRILADATIEPPREPPRTRGLLGLGFVLLLAGALLLLGFAGYLLFAASDIPLPIKIGLGALAAGAALLLGYVLRVRLRARGRDPYREVDL